VTNNANLDFVFNPKSVAIAGISLSRGYDAMPETYLKALVECKFNGPIYAIHPKGGEFRGRKLYPSVKDVPDVVDYVICCIPRAAVPQLIRDCAAKGVKTVQFFTSGFGETGTDEGIKLEAEVCALAKQGGIRLIGPNCMGVYSPKSGLSFAPDYPTETGPVSYICQSGGNAIYFIRYAAQRGVRFSKVISFGNAADINENELMEYFTDDPETGIIAAYIEGFKDGRRFSRAVRRATEVKPVIIIKGGYTEAGARAAASHTGALAGSAKIWDGLVRQAGVIQVATLDELGDILVTFLYLPVPKGRRLAVLDVGGGASVMATDAYVSAGLELPQMPEELRRKARGLLDPDAAGLSVNNPFDLGGQYFNTLGTYPLMNMLFDEDVIDIIAFHLHLGINPPFPSVPREFAIAILDNAIRVYTETDKPMVVVIDQLTNTESWETAIACQQRCQQAKIPVYFSVHGTAMALERYISYHEKRRGL
jgi:acyl-CoA synthetase (NDP forming)